MRITARLFATIAVGVHLLTLSSRAAAPQSFVYVASPAVPVDGIQQAELIVFDGETNAVVTRLPLAARSAPGMVVSPDGRRLYAAGSIVDLEKHTVIGTYNHFGEHLGIRNDGQRLFSRVRSQFVESVYAVDLPGGTPNAVPGNGHVGLGPDVVGHPSLPRYYLLDTGTLQEYDAGTDAVIYSTYRGARGPLAVSASGDLLFLALENSVVSVINSATKNQTRTLLDDGNVIERIVAGREGRYILTAAPLANRVRMFDLESPARDAILDLNVARPVNVAAVPGAARLFVASSPIKNSFHDTAADTVDYGNTILVFDATGRALSSLPLPDTRIARPLPTREHYRVPDGVIPMGITPSGAPRCAYRLNTTLSSWSTSGGTGSVTLTSPCSWIASTDASWIHLQQTSGASGTTIDFTVDRATTGAGRSATMTIAGQLVSVAQAGLASNPPFGLLETPTETGGPLTGSVAVTGWVLDDVAVTGVSVWRDPHPNDPAAAVVAAGPYAGKVYIGNGTFVDGARPDVAAAFPTTPQRTRGGWGYLMLTRGLVWDGQGAFRLYGYATDFEGNTALLGTKFVTVDNRAATKPFGAIDAPGPDATVSGSYNVVGWVLTPNTGASIPASGVRVSIDGVVLPDIPSMFNRTDITGGFPGFNTTGAGRSVVIDTTN